VRLSLHGRNTDTYEFSVFTMSEKPETCPQTHFIDQLCDNLLSQRFQQPTDRLLVALVKVERLAQSIEIMKTSRKMGGHSGVPLNLIVPGFQQQISNLKESFSEDLMVDGKSSEVQVSMPLILDTILTSKSHRIFASPFLDSGDDFIRGLYFGSFFLLLPRPRQRNEFSRSRGRRQLLKYIRDAAGKHEASHRSSQRLPGLRFRFLEQFLEPPRRIYAIRLHSLI